MSLIHICAVALIALFAQTTEAQYINQVRHAIPTRTYVTTFEQPCQPCYVPQAYPPCSCSSADDLNKLVILAKMLIEKNSEHASKNHINAEAIIKKLIDTLLYTTIQYNNCRAVLDKVLAGCGSGSGGKGNGSGCGTGGGGKPLIDLDILNPNSPNNVLDLDLAGLDLLGIGLGKLPGSSGSNNSGSGSVGGSGKGSPSLIDLGLLRPNQQGNVLDLGLGGTDLLGVGIGNTDGSGSKGGNASSSGSSQGSGKGSSSQGGLIDLNLLNPNSPDNVLGLDLGKQDVLGVGLGDPK